MSQHVARSGELLRIVAEIAERKGRIGRDIYGIGTRLLRIQEQELWRQGRYEGFEDFLEHGVDISRRAAYRFMRIAEHFNAEIAARYGVTKLEAALRYLAVTEADELPGDLLASDIQVRDELGRYRSLPLHEATASQIDEAARLLRQAQRGRTRIPNRVRQAVSALAERLPLSPKGTGGGERIRVSRGDDGRVALTFVAVPLDEIGDFLRAVRETLDS